MYSEKQLIALSNHVPSAKAAFSGTHDWEAEQSQEQLIQSEIINMSMNLTSPCTKTVTYCAGHVLAALGVTGK